MNNSINKYTKLEICQHISQNGIPLEIDKFNWNPSSKTFYSDEKDLMIFWWGLNSVNFRTPNNAIYCNSNEYITTKSARVLNNTLVYLTQEKQV